MARALIVGCGCRGRELGAGLIESGWEVRGTAREQARREAIAAAGIEPAVANPDQVASVLDLVADVTLVYWLLGSARGTSAATAALHGARLERVLERLVDTPVRGFVYEGAGTVGRGQLEHGARLVAEAGARWHIPFEVVGADPGDPAAWTRAMLEAAGRLTRADY